MLAKLNTFALVGIDAAPVEAEVDVSAGLPKTVLVGLPEASVRESIHRIERALVNLGYARHPGRTVINLAPADLRKDAGGFDLPIALGLLVATGQLLPEQLKDYAVVGELALDGSVRPVKGALSMAMAAAERGISKILVPAASAREAAVVKAVGVYGVNSLAEAVGVLSGQLPAGPVVAGVEELFAQLNTYAEDFTDVRGQEFAKRALVVAAAGAHNVLMLWTNNPPGDRRSMSPERAKRRPLQTHSRRGGYASARGPRPFSGGEANRGWAALLPAAASRLSSTRLTVCRPAGGWLS
jgi:magnesium chelatase family protein